MAALTQLYHPPDNPTPTHTSSYPFISPLKYHGKLKGKIVFITGAGRGIGRQAALAFIATGARIACISRTQSDLDGLLAEIDKSEDKSQTPSDGLQKSARAISIIGDVADPSFAPKAVQETEAKLGRVDILINHAGLSRVSDLEHETSVKEPWNVVEVSLLGSMSFTQAVIPSMIARGAGIVLNVISIIGRVTLPYFSAYSAAKAGLIKYTEVIDLELRKKGIKTFAVHPCMSLETTIARGCMNEVALREVKDLQDFMEEFVKSNTDHVDLPTDTFVALCCEERAAALSGKIVDATYDLETQMKKAEENAAPPLSR